MIKAKTERAIIILGDLSLAQHFELIQLPHDGMPRISTHYWESPAGAGVHWSLLFRQWGISVSALGVVGRDWQGQVVQQALFNQGVNVADIVIDSFPTGLINIWHDLGGAEYYSYWPGANRQLLVENLRQTVLMMKANDILLCKLTDLYVPILYILRKAQIAKLVTIVVWEEVNFLTPGICQTTNFLITKLSTFKNFCPQFMGHEEYLDNWFFVKYAKHNTLIIYDSDYTLWWVTNLRVIRWAPLGNIIHKNYTTEMFLVGCLTYCIIMNKSLYEIPTFIWQALVLFDLKYNPREITFPYLHEIDGIIR